MKVKKKDTYRIVYNGAKYRVEALRTERFLWWTWESWGMYLFADFNTIEKAEIFVRKQQEIHAWTEVKRFAGDKE